MPDTNLGYRMMKKKKVLVIVAIVVIAVATVGLYIFTTQTGSVEEIEKSVPTQVSSQGKHCTYTVGCDCSGFSPKTNGKEWEKSYCKHCGHHKKYHK